MRRDGEHKGARGLCLSLSGAVANVLPSSSSAMRKGQRRVADRSLNSVPTGMLLNKTADVTHASVAMICARAVFRCFRAVERFVDRVTGAAGPYFVSLAVILISVGTVCFCTSSLSPQSRKLTCGSRCHITVFALAVVQRTYMLSHCF